jgi:hypothetical protein
MRCQTIRANHDLLLIDLRRQPATNERDGIFHFEGECSTCRGTHWQHGASMDLSGGWKLKSATDDCACGPAASARFERPPAQESQLVVDLNRREKKNLPVAAIIFAGASAGVVLFFLGVALLKGK